MIFKELFYGIDSMRSIREWSVNFSDLVDNYLTVSSSRLLEKDDVFRMNIVSVLLIISFNNESHTDGHAVISYGGRTIFSKEFRSMSYEILSDLGNVFWNMVEFSLSTTEVKVEGR